MNPEQPKTAPNLKDLILSEYADGKIVILTCDGVKGAPLTEFIKQPADGMLYDLNRNESTILTFTGDPKWINDYAACKVIRALKARIDELEQAPMINVK
jgi:hypothetical protein